MQAVGKIGSYIGRSVYTVSGPFHPFGGAVDIIVVEQPDGTYKSSPWYVHFGKFQGMLKTKEKVVNISVNGVKADFNMYLDHKGEAFFLKEVDLDEVETACSPQSSSDDSSAGSERNGAAGVMTRSNSRRAQILGLVFGRKSRKEEVVRKEENAQDFVRTESLERAEIAADLLDLKWSTNLVSSRNTSRFSAVDMPKDGVKENPSADNDTSNRELEKAVEENGFEVKCSNIDCIAEAATSVERMKEHTDLLHSETVLTDKFGLATSDFHVSSVKIVSEVSKSDSKLQESVENEIDAVQSFYYSKGSESSGDGSVQCIEQRKGLEYEQEALNSQECLWNGDQLSFLHEEAVSMTGGTKYGTSEGSVTECFSQSVLVHQSNDSLEAVDSCSVAITSVSEQHNVLSSIQASGISQEEHLRFGGFDNFGSSDAKCWKFNCADHEWKETDSSLSSTVADGTSECIGARCYSVFSLDQSIIDDYISDVNPPRRRCKSISSDVGINNTGRDQPKELIRMVKSWPSMGSVSSNLDESGPNHSSNASSGAQTMPGDVNILNESRKGPAKPFLGKSPSSIDTFGGSRRGWPFSFKRSRTVRVSHVDMTGSGNPSKVIILNNSNDLDGGNAVENIKLKKKILKTLTPTSEQLASLNLKEGKNTVVFTFSTSMLGNQQVDARIFLWRWDTRIVISDVDGTITRSDLLGQMMPLVGMDWSQTGVAHLFSAIKENGYQLLFLSARSISQSFHTRQFLCNIRQDGKALPEGPIVISPDGLFPSLYREVVRRAPHEFKIACLEDIKALFPADRNPFYAGFGNRDTDEFSYVKIGIPRGKIFTINPKGEIVVNRQVHPKSYLSLHSLVHGMFPCMSSFEQEDYNSWNYWKLPPPVVDL